MSEEEIERLFKDSPEPPMKLAGGGRASVRPFEMVKAETTPEGLVRATVRITTNDVDRSNDIIEARGGKLDNYLKAPVVLWNHDHSIPAIAKCISIDVQDAYIDAVAEFSGISKLSQEIGKMVAGGYLFTASIGFIPLACQEQSVSPQMAATGNYYPGIPSVWRFTSWELLEWSFVNVPMNQNALIQNSFEDNLRRAVRDNVIAPDSEVIKYYERLAGTGRMVLTGQEIKTIAVPVEPEPPSATPTPEPTITPITKTGETMNDQAATADEQLEAAIAATNTDLLKMEDTPEAYDQKAVEAIEDLVQGLSDAVQLVQMKTKTPEILAVCKMLISPLQKAMDAIEALEKGQPPETDETDPNAAPVDPALPPPDPMTMSIEGAIVKVGKPVSADNLAKLNATAEKVKAAADHATAAHKMMRGFIDEHSPKSGEDAVVAPITLAEGKSKLDELISKKLK